MQLAFGTGSGGPLAKLTGAGLFDQFLGQHAGETPFQFHKGRAIPSGQIAHPPIQRAHLRVVGE